MDQHEIDRLCDIRDAARELADALPRCESCGQAPATHGEMYGGAHQATLYVDDCDACAGEAAGLDLPYATALRRLMKLLAD